MKASKIHLLFFLAFALGANAATVSVDTVKLAAGSWALSNASLGVPHGTTVSGATPYSVDGTNAFYAVSLEGGGTVFFAADDEIGPVLAFTAATNVDLTADSPLLNLLTRDVKARRRMPSRASTPMLLAANGTSSASAGTASASYEGERAKKLWAALTSPARPLRGPMLLGATASPQETLASSDIRVEPILTTQWSQTKDKAGNKCYNYYTPNEYPCGCVATAAGQIMYSWKWPTEELPQFSNSCTVDDVTTELDSSGPPRVYNWDAMVDKPGFATSEESRQAIGALLSDLGIAFGADYTKEGTGAFEWDVPEPMRTHFKYASAYTYSGRETQALHNAPVRQRAVLANLDAKRPVELYIISTRAGGHAVVADGYGYVTISGEKVEFTHINMGWAGTDEMWYNLPVIQTKEAGSQGGQTGGYTFEYLTGATFNIHPTETGDLLTGRILEDGEPVEGATVTVYAAGGTEPIANTTSDAHGIYSFALQGGVAYDVRASLTEGTKTKSGSADDVFLKATTVADTETYTTDDDDDIGNSWGNDIDIAIPHVRVVAGAETKLYNNLGAALTAAATLDDPVVEVFGPTYMKKPVTVVTNMTICVVADPASDYPTMEDCAITIRDDAVTADGWALQIADGVRVAFSNVVFTAESGDLPYVDVMATGTASVAGKIGIGAIKVQDLGGFVLAGALDPVGGMLSVSCPGATDRFSRFGTYECSKDDASACAGCILNALEQTLMGSVGAESGALVWDRVPVDPSIAAASAKNDNIGTTYYNSLDLLFKDYAGGAEVVVLRDCGAGSFTAPVTISNDFSIASADGQTCVVTASKDVCFSVTNGAGLAFTNVAFTRSGSGSQNFVTLDDGTFVLDDGAVIADLSLAGTASAVWVNKGTITMRDGSAITNCVATTGHKGYGAAVYLKGADCTMDFAGGTITGCKATGQQTYGAAVYAGAGSKIDVSGSAAAYGNAPSDVYYNQPSVLTLAGSFTGNVGVFCGSGYKEGKSFATVGDGVSEDAAKMACGHFVNDKNAKLSAAVSDDGKTLVWVKEDTGPKPVPEADAVVRLVLGDASDTYASLGDALEMADGADARLELLKDVSLDESVSFAGAVVLDGMGFELTRDDDFYLAVTNSTLTLTNIVLSGGFAGLGRILDVNGGSLVLESGTKICDVYGFEKSMVAPVVVWNGSFVMESGAEISDCGNYYEPEPTGALTAGAVLVNGQGASADFRGGTISGCWASRAGGVYIGNKAGIRISGDTKILGNQLLTGEENNLVVQDMSGLVLADILTGRVGYTEGVLGNTNVFGVIDAEFAASTTASNLVVSARRFTHDKTAAKGMVATNETEAILVWSTAVGDSTEFTNTVDGVTTVYDVVLVEVDDDDPEIIECEPFSFVALEEVSADTWKLTLKPGTEYCVYTLMTSDDLETWTQIGEKKTLSAEDMNDELEFVFEAPASGVKRFWKVEGANGLK